MNYNGEISSQSSIIISDGSKLIDGSTDMQKTISRVSLRNTLSVDLDLDIEPNPDFYVVKPQQSVVIHVETTAPTDNTVFDIVVHSQGISISSGCRGEDIVDCFVALDGAIIEPG